MTFLRTALAVVALNLPLHAQPTPTAAEAWASVSGTDAIVFATINNPSMYDLYIVSGKSVAAEAVTLMDGDKTITSITVPAYGSVELKSGAQRIRLAGLKSKPKAGDELKVTLETDGGASIEIAAVVKSTEP